MRALLAASLSLCAACSQRLPTNPYDPRNPQTQGRPLRLWAIPADHFVRLHWVVPDAGDLGAPLLLSPHDAAVETVATGLPLRGTWVDPWTGPGPRTYVLQVEVRGWAGVHRSDTCIALPSPGACWLAFGSDRVALLSASSPTFLPSTSVGVFVLDVAPGADVLWVAGSPGGTLSCVGLGEEGLFLREDLATSLSLRSLSVSAVSARILLAHGLGLTWYETPARRLVPWEASLPEPVVARLAPDEDAAWVYCRDESLWFVAPDGAGARALGYCPGVRELSPTTQRHCWVASRSGLFLASQEGLRSVHPHPTRSVASLSPELACACAQSHVFLARADGITQSARAMAGVRISRGEGSYLWVVTADSSVWKLTPHLQEAARLRLPEQPWAVAAGGP